MSHVTLCYCPCRMPLSPISHVEFEKSTCHPVDVRGGSMGGVLGVRTPPPPHTHTHFLRDPQTSGSIVVLWFKIFETEKKKEIQLVRLN